MSLYTALAQVSAHALERLNRFGDKQRIKNRTLARKLLQTRKIKQKEDFYEENNI
jgi:hypothetical protein